VTWADDIVGQITERFATEIKAGKPLIIRDEKTLSGRVHIGSLRGIVIHGLIAQILKEKGISSKFLFELNDADPIDGLPASLEASYREYLGKPLFAAPSPEPGHVNFPMYFGDELQSAMRRLELPIEWYTLRPLYESGKFNETIRLALENSEKIQSIYAEVSGGKKPDDWYPLQVICEHCGKMGTTQVTGWDGKEVTYTCKPDLVTWAQGCGHRGSMSPFDGHAKLPWKVEWAAKWKVIGVDIEGCGKDHSAAGGSRSIAARISKEVFHYPNPFDIPYEFFNIGGRKMSASKGLGASAKEVSDLLPPALLKLLMIRKQPNQPIDFDPEGVTIPQLFDEYDRLADHYFGRHEKVEPDFARIFTLTQTDFPKQPKDLWHMRFTLVSFIIQMPHLNLLKEAEAAKGTPLSADEKQDLNERAMYARQWLDSYAPARQKFTFVADPVKMKNDLPSLSDAQKKALSLIAERLKTTAWEGDPIHKVLHAVKAELAMPPREIFAPLYQLFFKRDDGPQMGWFLSTLPKEDVLNRIRLYI
jgi:lysyl-tRNA synthetase class 1